MAGEESGGESPWALSPNSHSHQPLWLLEGRGSRFPQSGNCSGGEFPPQKTPPRCRPSEERPLLVCTFGPLPSHSISEVADVQGKMASDFQSATERLDHGWLKIRDHPVTREDSARPLEGSNVPKDAFPPRAARSSAGGEGGPWKTHNNRS